jgi:hypothetical protein
MAIVEFLASLKYYASEWPRAKNFALMLGFYQSDDSFVSLRKSGTSDTKLPPRLNDGKINELDEPYYDIYLQEFYLHCYSILNSEQSNF